MSVLLSKNVPYKKKKYSWPRNHISAFPLENCHTLVQSSTSFIFLIMKYRNIHNFCFIRIIKTHVTEHWCLIKLMCCAVVRCSVVSDSLQPHGLQSARLLCPWGFSRQENWSGLPCPPSEYLTNPGIEPGSPALQAGSLLSESPEKPLIFY